MLQPVGKNCGSADSALTSSYVQLVLRTQGSPGPVGPPGSAGPSGEKVECQCLNLDLIMNIVDVIVHESVGMILSKYVICVGRTWTQRPTRTPGIQRNSSKWPCSVTA